jgi:GAF domain-containing protein
LIRRPGAGTIKRVVPEGIEDVAPWPDWAAAAGGVARFLRAYVGWDLWMVTRVVGDEQIVLHAEPSDEVRPGSRLPWEKSFCRQMVEGSAPRLATVTAVVPAYANLTKGLGRDVAAYLGVPIVAPDGSLFGTLCGISFRAKPLSAARDLSLVEIMARMLGTLLAAGLEPPPTPPPPD